MTANDVLAMVREWVLENTEASLNAIADIYEERGDAEMVSSLRTGIRTDVVRGSAAAIRGYGSFEQAAELAVRVFRFRSVGEIKAFQRGLVTSADLTEGGRPDFKFGSPEDVENYVRSLFAEDVKQGEGK